MKTLDIPTWFADEEQHFNNRINTLAAQESGGINSYPHRFQITRSIVRYIQKYEMLESGERREGEQESLGGRVMHKRSISSKLFFYDLHSSDGIVQVVADLRNSELDEAGFSRFHHSVQRGDIVGVDGFPGKTRTGELAIFPKLFIVIAPCLRWLPYSALSPLASI